MNVTEFLSITRQEITIFMNFTKDKHIIRGGVLEMALIPHSGMLQLVSV